MDNDQQRAAAHADAAREGVNGRPATGHDTGNGTPPAEAPKRPKPPVLPKEIGGTTGPEPTRYGDWEHKGRCTDF